LVERGVTGVFNSGPGPLSLLAALFVTRSAQDLIRHFHPLGADQRFVGGAQQLTTKMAERLNGKVFTNAYVYQINRNAGGVEVVADRITVRARRAIVTLPPALAGRIRFDPPLPASRDHLTQSTPMGWVIKVHCIYPTRFWHDAGLSGGVTSDEGAIRTTADNSPPSGSPGILVGFIEGAATTCPRPAPGYWTQGLWTTYGPDLRTPIGALHWAGAETSPEWNGKMEGAVQSGEHAAAEVLKTM
jgi:monoamine oxidase